MIFPASRWTDHSLPVCMTPLRRSTVRRVFACMPCRVPITFLDTCVLCRKDSGLRCCPTPWARSYHPVLCRSRSNAIRRQPCPLSSHGKRGTRHRWLPPSLIWSDSAWVIRKTCHVYRNVRESLSPLAEKWPSTVDLKPDAGHKSEQGGRIPTRLGPALCR